MGGPKQVEGNLDTCDRWLAPVDSVIWLLAVPNRRTIPDAWAIAHCCQTAASATSGYCGDVG